MTLPTDPPRRASRYHHMLTTAEYDPRTRSVATVRARRAIKAAHAAERTGAERFADRLTELSSSTPFLLLHLAWFTGWIVWNAGVAGLPVFDPYPYGLLTMIVSLEAIVLSSLVLLAQRRDLQLSELREEMQLQVLLRTEEEVTKTLQIVAALYEHQGHDLSRDDELQAMLQPLDADAVERDLAQQLAAGRIEAPPVAAARRTTP